MVTFQLPFGAIACLWSDVNLKSLCDFSGAMGRVVIPSVQKSIASRLTSITSPHRDWSNFTFEWYNDNRSNSECQNAPNIHPFTSSWLSNLAFEWQSDNWSESECQNAYVFELLFDSELSDEESKGTDVGSADEDDHTGWFVSTGTYGINMGKLFLIQIIGCDFYWFRRSLLIIDYCLILTDTHNTFWLPNIFKHNIKLLSHTTFFRQPVVYLTTNDNSNI